MIIDIQKTSIKIDSNWKEFIVKNYYGIKKTAPERSGFFYNVK